MKYAVNIEKTTNGYSAYPPDLPGVGVAAATIEETKALIREAIEFHIEGLRESNEPVPAPATLAEYVEVSVA